MEFGNKTILFLTFFFSFSIFGKSKLPELITKQTLKNLRYISHDGKFTYYQRRSGNLLLSTNYSVTKVLKGKEGTQYFIYSSPTRKKIIISQDESYHSYLALRKNHKLYILDYGKSKTELIGEGLSPQLHQKDKWISFYNAYTRNIHIINVQSKSLAYKIKIFNNKNPYFVPQVVISGDSVFYTDINALGMQGLLRFSRSTKKSNIVLKADAISIKYQLCLINNDIAIFQTGIKQVNKHSEIALIAVDSAESFTKEKNILYTSKMDDIGNMQCHIDKNKIFFIKNIFQKEKEYSEVYSIDLITKKLHQISDLNFATQIISMDGRLLLPYRDKFFVLYGEKDLKSIDTLKAKDSK